MNRLTYRLALAGALAVTLSSCGGSTGNPIAPVVVATSSAVPLSTTGAAAVPYGAKLLAGATYLGPATLKDMGVDIGVTMRDAAGLRQYALDSSTPGSATYRHWLTPQQIGDRFGADAATYAATVATLNAQHLAVKTYPQREILRVRGAQTDLERVLGTKFGLYRKGTQVFVGPSTAPHPAASLHVTSLGNTVSYTVRHRNLVPVRVGTNYLQGYAPQQIANAFDFSGAYAKGFKGDGISIGIIGTGPITDGDPRINTGDVQDIRKLYSVSGTGAVVQIYDISNVSPGTGTQGSSYSTGLASPPPVTNPAAAGCAAQGYSPGDSTSNIVDFTTCNPEDIEAQLDTEQAATLAPDATVNFYIAYNPMECNGTCGNTNALPPAQELGLPESDDEIQEAIADNKSDIISMSFGSDELDNDGIYYGSGSNNFGTTELAMLASEGIAIFVSSGDAGAQGCAGSSSFDPDALCVSYPATDPSAVSVGGVNAPLDDSGKITGPLTGWGEQTQNATLTASGSGGGCSIYFQGPTYEQAPFLAVSPSATLCNGNRTQPDMSMDGDTNTGVAVVTNADATLGGRSIFAVGGTSVAAPEMSAMWALVLEACKNTAKCNSAGSSSSSTPWRLGNPNPLLFPLLNSGNSSAYAAAFYDVQFGNNSLPSSDGSGTQDSGYTAGTGYDLVTGLGVPFGANLIKYVVGV